MKSKALVFLTFSLIIQAIYSAPQSPLFSWSNFLSYVQSALAKTPKPTPTPTPTLALGGSSATSAVSSFATSTPVVTAPREGETVRTIVENNQRYFYYGTEKVGLQDFTFNQGQIRLGDFCLSGVWDANLRPGSNIVWAKCNDVTQIQEWNYQVWTTDDKMRVRLHDAPWQCIHDANGNLVSTKCVVGDQDASIGFSWRQAADMNVPVSVSNQVCWYSEKHYQGTRRCFSPEANKDYTDPLGQVRSVSIPVGTHLLLLSNTSNLHGVRRLIDIANPRGYAITLKQSEPNLESVTLGIATRVWKAIPEKPMVPFRSMMLFPWQYTIPEAGRSGPVREGWDMYLRTSQIQRYMPFWVRFLTHGQLDMEIVIREVDVFSAMVKKDKDGNYYAWGEDLPPKLVPAKGEFDSIFLYRQQLGLDGVSLGGFSGRTSTTFAWINDYPWAWFPKAFNGYAFAVFIHEWCHGIETAYSARLTPKSNVGADGPPDIVAHYANASKIPDYIYLEWNAWYRDLLTDNMPIPRYRGFGPRAWRLGSIRDMGKMDGTNAQ